MTSHEFTREYLEANLDNPDDPYGLAHVKDFIIKEMAACFTTYRYEHVRRYRLAHRVRPDAATD